MKKKLPADHSATFSRFLVTVLSLIVGAISSSAYGETALDESVFTDAIDTAEDMPRLRSLLISQNDQIVVEKYFNGQNARRKANVKSVSKSIISALVGIAIEKGYIANVDEPISTHFGPLIPDYSGTAKEHITVGNLLSMQAGLETTSFYNYGKWVLSDNWVRFALDQPLRAEPGTKLQYSTGNTHLLSAILTQATGKTTLAFAREVLAGPLGFELAPWPRDPDGIYFGGNNMELTPRQMLAFGLLYLNEGQRNGNQVIPATWVETSFTPLAESAREEGRFYGYGWWMREMAGYPTTFAWGYGGQFILLVPKLDLVVVTTSSSLPGNNRRAHIRSLYALLEDKVVRPAATVATPPNIEADD
ncbi:MAG: serine hydrolase domain-containing protein [Woeseiaceae bacterium]